MKKILVCSAFLIGSVAAHAESCQPSFQIERDRCIESSKVTGIAPRSEQKVAGKEKRETRAGKELSDVYCSGPKQEFATKWKVSPEDVQVTADNQDSKEPWVELSFTSQTAGSYRKIVCTLSAQVPVFEKVQGDTCEILAASDLNKCFSADRVNVETSAITDCEYKQPKNIVEAWQKSSCLVEAYTAAKQSRLILSAGEFDKLEGAMTAYSRSAPNKHLKAYLQTELQSQ